MRITFLAGSPGYLDFFELVYPFLHIFTAIFLGKLFNFILKMFMNRSVVIVYTYPKRIIDKIFYGACVISK